MNTPIVIPILIDTPFGLRRIEVIYDVRWRTEPERLSVRETGPNLEARNPVVNLLRDLADAFEELANREEPNAARVRLVYRPPGVPT